jgi:ubiquinone/menaquinone biosynthesis C-methylase UbiE
MEAEENLKTFYEGSGWKTDDKGHTTDAQLFEDLRKVSQKYVSACRKKVKSFLPDNGNLFLDAASGPIQYPEYVDYSAGFNKRVCVDISETALSEAKRKLGSHVETVCTSLLSLPFPENHFDTVLSLHTIYHIDKEKQEKAVRELLRVAKPNTPIVIVYSNPNRLLARAKKLLSKKDSTPAEGALYFYAHPLNWWAQFEDQAQVTLTCWRSLTAKDAHRFIPDNFFGRWLLSFLLTLENWMPKQFCKWGAYPLIVMKKF